MGLQKSCNAHKMHVPGTWRSLVARFLGVEEVASSNLAVPTTDLWESPDFRVWRFFYLFFYFLYLLKYEEKYVFSYRNISFYAHLIANFLSAFDKKKILVRKEVDTLQTIKKYLLQQMFV